MHRTMDTSQDRWASRDYIRKICQESKSAPVSKIDGSAIWIDVEMEAAVVVGNCVTNMNSSYIPI